MDADAEEPNIPDEYYPIVEYEAIDMVDCRSSHKTIKLNGPKSPLEVDVYSANSENGIRNIHIDTNSVNSVLLATPEDVRISFCFIISNIIIFAYCNRKPIEPSILNIVYRTRWWSMWLQLTWAKRVLKTKPMFYTRPHCCQTFVVLAFWWPWSFHQECIWSVTRLKHASHRF